MLAVGACGGAFPLRSTCAQLDALVAQLRGLPEELQMLPESGAAPEAPAATG